MDFADLAVAVMICRKTSRLRQWQFPAENGFVTPRGLRAHLLTCRMRFARYWPVHWGGGLLKETKRLHAYLHGCWDAEAHANLIQRRRSGGQPLGTPWPLVRVIVMCHYLRITRREALTMPLAQVEWYMAGIEEQMTDSRVMAGAVKEEDTQITEELHRWEDLSLEDALAIGKEQHAR